MLSKYLLLSTLVVPLLALDDPGVIIPIAFGALFVVLVLLIVFLTCCCPGGPTDTIVENNLGIVTTDPYWLPPQTAVTPFINENIANAYLNNLPTITTNQFLVSPYPNGPYPPPLPHLQAMHPINPTATYTGRDTCTICFADGTNIKLLPCSHQFHANCIVEWCHRRRSCPNCNAINFQAFVLCSSCHRFNEAVSFCPVGCQKPNHMGCFMQRNQGKLVCSNCAGGAGMSFPRI